ncbi:MAG TPA: Stk1 family PASTA domain-containing Ser/Thr kinase [Actinomycetes bacterium]|nr:Stk1 family PASTA domain-containing Ser/Thr kinase [Actinomycetes bacterium]
MSGDRTNGTLGGRYELGDLLGHGGMADVRKATDLRLGRTVAVKMLRTDLAKDATFQARFRREAQSAASLNASSVVAVYDTGEDELDGVRVPYIVMEYVEGQTLRDVLRSGQRLMPNRALEIAAGVLAALEYSHREGIVHRDIKPANVMLARNGDVKVMDFGIARAVADSGATMTQTANVLGTAQYLSPEQARGETVDSRSDIYSTGCLLYELLTGRPPFQGESPVAVAYQHVRENPVPPSTLNPDVGSEADAIVMKALTKNPANRYQSASEMRVDIERALQGATVTAPPVMAEPPTQALTTVTEPPPEDEEKSRKGAYAALIIAVLIVLALLGWGAWALLGNSPNNVEVPDVVGMKLKPAQAELEDAGFEVEVETQTSDEPENQVLTQDPAGNTEAEEGSTVNLVVSAGPEQVEVPEVEGLTEDAAIDAIESAGLNYAGSNDVPSDQPAGIVVGSDPDQGRTVDAGTDVTLDVSNGEVQIPNVVGDSQEEATTKLETAGFNVEPVFEETDSAAAGTVIDQSQTGFARLGTTIVITVAEAPPEPSPTPSDTATEEQDNSGNSDGNNGNDNGNGPPDG